MLIRSVVLAAAAVMLSVFPAVAAEPTGRDILDEVSRRHDRPYEYESQVMTLINADQSKERREVERFKRDVDSGSRYLLVFQEPAGVKGTALLTWQNRDREDDQWIYLPASGSDLKRIAKGGRKNYFMGTDYTYEDLATEPRSKFSYDRQPDEAVDNVDCFVVNSTPVDEILKKESGYKFTKMWIRKDIFFVVRIDYFDRQGELIKRQTWSKLQNVSGETWRANLAVMKNLDQKHVTAVQVAERSFEPAASPAEVFTTQYVSSNRHVK